VRLTSIGLEDGMGKRWTKRHIALYIGAIIVGSLGSTLVPGDMLTRFLITFPILIIVMVGGIYALDRQARARETTGQ
jgi:hypothetical protein